MQNHRNVGHALSAFKWLDLVTTRIQKKLLKYCKSGGYGAVKR